MLDIILETLVDGVKLIPFLFVAFIVIELIEHKLSTKSKKIISESGKFGPGVGSLLGLFPQCGFSVMATNLYITRIITLGTLISVYLSTSDEMLPILLSRNVEMSLILKILAIKFLIGMIAGYIIDFIFRKKINSNKDNNYDICEQEHCHCEHSIVVSALKHTLNTLIFIMLISFVLNIGFEYIGEDNVSKIFMKNSLFGPFVASLVGLIPNCGASIMLTELYLNSAISFSSLIGGLLTGSGVAILVLFKSNKNIKESLAILFTIYGIGVISGIIIEVLGILF